MGYREGDETVSFEGKIEHATAKAYLVEPTIGEKVWVPKSQCVSMSEPDGEGNRMFTVTEWWFGKQKGLL